MQHKNIIEVTDFNQAEWLKLINQALKFKKNKTSKHKILKNKQICLVFDSHSLRTKISFEAATHLLGGNSFFIDVNTVIKEKDNTPRETFEDILETLDRMTDCYVLRDYSQKILEVIKRKNNPPFINGFCQTGHPSQALADLAVIKWKKKKLNNLNYTAVCPSTGSGVIESFIYGVLLLGEKITIITPTGKFEGKNKNFSKQIKILEKQYKGQLILTSDIQQTIKSADVLYIDEWWENNKNFLKKKMGKYRVDNKFLKNSKKSLSIMHCLPAHPGREITPAVMYSSQSIIFDQAEFRVYSAMSLLTYLFK